MNDKNSGDSQNSTNSKNFKNFFFNRVGRARSGWRFLIFQLLFVVLGFPIGLGIELLLRNLSIVYEKGGALSFVVQNFTLLALSLVFGWLCGKFLEGLPFRALGASPANGWFRDLVFGLIVGAVSIAFAVLIAISFGGMRLQLNQTSGTAAILSTLAVSFAVFTLGAAAEEAYFRGYILQTFARARLAWVAVVFTSLFFASAHLGNAGATVFSTFNTILAGVWFVAAYFKTRNLWFPSGIHLAWNWFQGAVFGSPVSGVTGLTPAPFLQQIGKGTEWLTGGDYGIEGGVACTIAIIASGVIIWFSPIFKPTEEMLKLTSEENARVNFIDAAVLKSPEF